MAEKSLREAEGNNLGDSALEEHVAHWADVLDRWVQSIDARLGRRDGRVAPPPLNEGDAGPSAEQ